MVCAARGAARGAAHGSRVESWAEGRERREDGADDRFLLYKLGSLCLGRAASDRGAVSHGAAASQEALRSQGATVRGAAETPRLGARDRRLASEIRLDTNPATRGAPLRL